MKIFFVVSSVYAIDLKNSEPDLPTLNMPGMYDLTPEKVAAWNPFASMGLNMPPANS